MATRFKGECVIIGVQVGEIRVREIGRSPSVMAKMALMTDTGESAGVYIQHMFSERTGAILRQLIESMEADATSMLSREESEASESADEDINYYDNSEDDDDIAFR